MPLNSSMEQNTQKFPLFFCNKDVLENHLADSTSLFTLFCEKNYMTGQMLDKFVFNGVINVVEFYSESGKVQYNFKYKPNIFEYLVSDFGLLKMGQFSRYMYFFSEFLKANML